MSAPELADLFIGRLPCDCPMDPYHRWNCSLTPLCAQTIRDLDINPWTATREGRP